MREKCKNWENEKNKKIMVDFDWIENEWIVSGCNVIIMYFFGVKL